jgi:EAL domain-containing protein (putative c-di-GMP-specific phosphodiesterase class I)
MELHYQPQYDYSGDCIGVEALLRWNHPVFGMLYPPLVIKLAEDGGFLAELEEAIVRRVLDEADAVARSYGPGVKISFNVTGTTVVTDRFLRFCKQLDAERALTDGSVCIEVTEQATLSFDDATLEVLGELHAMGLKLAIDDFSMGHTSINYLKNDLFDAIKLDGSLVRGLSTHANCREIVSSVVQLADTLHMTVIAEYVETEEQRDILHEIGCDCYQGWLYSPAVPLNR